MSSLPVTTVAPARRLRGTLRVPGDKSVAHRYAILAALADGRSILHNFAPGADCRSTLNCLSRLGVAIQDGPAGTVTLLGRGFGQLRSADGAIDAGNSGTTMRLLAGVLAGHPFSTTVFGDASLSRRPMRRVIEPLERMGARIDATDGHPPITVHGAALHAIDYEQTAPSAQVKSAVLLAGLHAEGRTTVVEPAATRDHTERAVAAFGGRVSMNGLRVSVTGGQQLVGQTLTIPGDFSSAAFWLVGAAALPGSRVQIDDVGLNPTRTALLNVLRRFGARVTAEVTSTEAGEPRGTVVVEGECTRALQIGAREVPGLIDELPAIAALAAHGGAVTVHGAGELRVKESDRISALVAGFRAMGIDANELADGFAVRASSGPFRPSGGVADAHGDHRMAMAFAIAALGGAEASTIEGADVVGISYPGFFETLRHLVEGTE